jgi:hypothetical protein
MFHNISTFIGDAEELNFTSLRNIISEPLTNLIERFELYFPTEEDPRKENIWTRNPFVPLTGTTI